MLYLFKKLYLGVSQIGQETKNWLIIGMFLLTSIVSYYSLGEKIAEDINSRSEEMLKDKKNYAKKMVPIILDLILKILLRDPDVYNVILLSYHNLLHSYLGFSYLFINGIMEEGRWEKTEPCIDSWSELSAINFGPELNKIHNLNYLRIHNLEDAKLSYPKLYFKLKECGANAAAFYPILSNEETAGMLVMLYKEPKQYLLGYFMKTIEPSIVELYNILNYIAQN